MGKCDYNIWGNDYGRERNILVYSGFDYVDESSS